jgi:hypothetical protein
MEVNPYQSPETTNRPFRRRKQLGLRVAITLAVFVVFFGLRFLVDLLNQWLIPKFYE